MDCTVLQKGLIPFELFVVSKKYSHTVLQAILGVLAVRRDIEKRKIQPYCQTIKTTSKFNLSMKMTSLLPV